MNFNAFIRHYAANFRSNKEKELDWFERQPSFESAIINAADAKDERGKMCSHQYRVDKVSMKRAKEILLENIDDLEKSDSFHSLWLLMNYLIKPIKGIGEVYISDTALRIGAFLKIYSEKVYLHAGTRTGAERLKIRSSNKDWIELNKLPKDFQKLAMNEVEDILCIYKDDFMNEKVDYAKSCSTKLKGENKSC